MENEKIVRTVIRSGQQPTEEQIREYFKHLSKLGELSGYEQKYFIGSLVRKVHIRDGKLLFSLPGFEQFSVILTPENNGKSL